MDFRRQGLSPCLSLLMSSFSLVISPPDPSQAGFTENSASSDAPRKAQKRTGIISHYALLPRELLHILSFGSWLEPRYIFAARQLV